MSMSKSSNTYNRVKWEDSEFPILCQTCLGNNPYLRMMKDKYGKECKICSRPFTTFRWCPGRGMRYKNTEICQTCSKLKNVCQTCLLDLEYGLPVQVRDYALGLQDDLPKTGANKDFYIQNAEREIASGDGTTPAGALAKIGDQGPNELLQKLARSQPYYDRNRPHICSFWVKGECKRGEECPYRHEKPTDPDDPLSDQNIKDRYYGSKDPVADKLLNRARALPTLQPPEDKTITTLYIGNLGDNGEVTEKDLRNYFYQFGELRSISVLPGKGCSFVQFTTRQAAEAAVEKTFNKLTLSGRRITIRWGRAQAQQNVIGQMADDSSATRRFEPVPGLPQPLPAVDFFNLASGNNNNNNNNNRNNNNEGPDKKRLRTDVATNSSVTNMPMSTSSFPNMGGFMPPPPMPPFMFQPGMPPPPRPLIVPRVPYINPTPTSSSPMMMMPPRLMSLKNFAPSVITASNANRSSSSPGSSEKKTAADNKDGLQQQNQPSTSKFVPLHYPSQDPQHLGAKDLPD